MVEIFTVVGVMILIIISLFIGKIISFVGKIVFVALFVTLIAVLMFGVSLDQTLDFLKEIVLLAF